MTNDCSIYERRSSVGGPAYLSLAPKLKTLNPWNRHCRRAIRHLSLIEYRVCSHVCWPGGQHLLFAVNQVAGVKAGDFETVSVGDRIRGTRLDAISAEDTSVVIDVIDLGVTLCSAHPMLGRILCRLDVNAIRGTRRRAQEAGNALLQPILVTLQDVHAAKTLLKLGAPKRSRPIRIVLYLCRLEHLHERNAHALGDGRYVLQDWHTHLVYRKPYPSHRIGQQMAPAAWRKAEFRSAVKANAIGLLRPLSEIRPRSEKARLRRRFTARAFSNCRHRNCMQFLDKCLLCLWTKIHTPTLPLNSAVREALESIPGYISRARNGSVRLRMRLEKPGRSND